MGGFIDLTGETFGRLSVLRREENDKRGTIWTCLCECGVQKVVSTQLLRTGHAKSCGCLQREAWCKTTHGATNTKAFRAWQMMKNRCTNKNHKDWLYYGIRGITFCERWGSFENFLADMGPPEGDVSLDRIDVNGNYEPANCRWADSKTQARNRRNNRLITLDGVTRTMSEWSEVTGFGLTTIRARINNGWSVERALSTPPKKYRYGD